MESKTLNQIFDGFEQFAINHPQIQSYDLGTELQLDLKKTEQFTKMFVLVGPAVWGNPSVAPSFQIKIVDKVLTDKATSKWHINEILSDTIQICTDFVAFLKFNRLIAQATTVTFNPEIFDQDNELAGWSFNVILSTEMIITSCFVNPLVTQTCSIQMDEVDGEYLEAPAVQILPDSTADLDLEFVFSAALSQKLTVFSFGEILGSDSFSLFLNGTSLTINLMVGGDVKINTGATITAVNSGTITVIGNPTFIEVAIDGNVLITTQTDGPFDLTILNSFKSQYGATFNFFTQIYEGFEDVTLDKIKVQGNTWTFPEGSGSTTESDTSVVMTLNSTSDVEEMWNCQ